MTTQTHAQAITDFLLTRIAEDEAYARAALDESEAGEGGHDYVWARLSPHNRLFAPGAPSPIRVLSTCAGRRRTILSASALAHWDDPAVREHGDLILRAMAQVYADHPDYRSEWAL